jgi:hypothetical protein
MQSHLFDDVLLTAAAEVAYRQRVEGASTEDLLARAFSAAVAQSGFAIKNADGLGVASFTLAPDHAIDLAWRLGVTPRCSHNVIPNGLD